jgi:LacI family transcriptional regulator
MTTTLETGPSKAHWLAKRIEEDIRMRGLREGEPYLTTSQAGSQMGISKSMAYRAMKILVARQVLVSHPGRGTFVGSQFTGKPLARTKCIHILLSHDLFLSSGQSTHGWLAGISSALPGNNIQLDFFTSREGESNVELLLEQAISDGTMSAAVLIGCPQAIQEQVLRRGVPALVLGTDYSSTRQLPSVDADQYETGRLAAEYLLKNKYRRIALLMRETWFPGDRAMFEGVGRALDEAGLGHDSLLLRNLSVDPPVLSADLERLLAAEDRPTGCICRMPFFAEAVLQAAKNVGLRVPDDLGVVCNSLDRQTAGRMDVPSVCMKVRVEEQAATGGRMLAELLQRRQPDPLHVVLPVELVEPKRRERRKTEKRLKK